MKKRCGRSHAPRVSAGSSAQFSATAATSNAAEADLNSDILAGVNFERNGKLGDRMVGFIVRCDQAQCGDPQTLKVVTFAHRWAVNRPELVTVRWRKATKDFQFVVGTETRVLTYGDILPFDRELPKNFFFPIGIQNTVANCASAVLGP